MEEVIPTITREDFTKDLKKKRWLRTAFLEITSTCNLRCVHCYLGHLTTIAAGKKNELTYEEINRILDDLADHGCYYLFLTGGEPLTRKDFFPLYDLAFKKDFLIVLFTNATLIDKKTAAFLQDHPPQIIDISMYGMTPQTYESITQVSGSFQRFRDGLQLLFDHSLPVELKTVLLQQNKHELFAFKKYCEEKGIRHRCDPFVNARMNLEQTPFDFRVPPEEAAELMYRYRGEKPQEESKRKHLYTQCGAGETSAYVTSTGHLQCCTIVNEYNSRLSTDLRRTPFNEAWKNLSIRPKVPVEKKCKTCSIVTYCNQCPARAYLATGKKNKIDEYACRYAQATAASINQT